MRKTTSVLTLVVTLLAAVRVFAQEGMPQRSQFLIRLEPVRGDMNPRNMTEAERGLAIDLFLRMKRLQTEGKLTFAGQVMDPASFSSMALVNAPDAASAQALLADAPALKNGLYRPVVLPFFTLLEAANRTPKLTGGKMLSDVEYGRVGGESLKLDAWIPDGAGPHPAVILVHGGGWKSGDKLVNFTEVFQPLSRAGFAFFTVNYRLAPKYTYPAPVEDVVQAVRYVKAHAAEYRIDPKRIAISGESAGGHLAALVGARYGRELGLAAVAAFYPATDLSALVEGPDKTEEAYRALLPLVGAREVDEVARARLRDASPIAYVQADMPPFLFVHGTGDQLLPFHQSRVMCERMQAAGAVCEVFVVEGAPHSVVLWEEREEWTGYKQKLPEWLKATMR